MIAQVPALTMVTVAPFVPPVVQTAVLVEAKVTGRPEAPPVAVSVTVPLGVKVCEAGAVKVTTCAALPMAKLRLTSS
ncbi:MAG: hypothetical protein ACOVRP_03250, partial [Gemmatimonas sp.]